MTSVNVTTTQNTVTVSDDGSTVTIKTGDVSQDTFDALLARVAQLESQTGDLSQDTFDALAARIAQLESVDYLVLQDGN